MNCENAAPSIRIIIARYAALLLAFQENWEESSNLLEGAIKLLPLISPRSLQHTDKRHMLADFAGLASMAAATALNAGKEAHHALQLLELGRGVIASLLLEIRTDVSALRQQHSEYADKFILLRNELDSPADGTTLATSSDNAASWELLARRRREADQRFSELLISIRAQPGFNNFLCPPTVDELMAAADPDPIIVVNMSSYRCDAFLIQRDRIMLLKLLGLTLKEAQKRAKGLQSSRFSDFFRMTSLLEWLWDVVCHPCLEALGFKDPTSDNNSPRVWWIPTGILSRLPLHTAGRRAQGPTETVLDRVMSSYSSSVKALIYERRHHANRKIKSSSNYALLAAMHETPGLSQDRILPFAGDEVKIVKNLCLSLQLKPIEPTLCKDDVLSHLQACRVFHFAGHGQSNSIGPSKSCLLLQDWESSPLTVEDFRNHRLQKNPPFLGYLSACSTGANEADRLVDEGIHLVSTLQLAGFRHVIGTLWEVSDEHCVDVAKVVYETLRDEGMTDIAVCRGLHRAIRALRNGRIEREQASDDINATVAAVENNNRDGRTATLVSCGSPSRNSWNPYWLQYVHFGV